MKLMPEAPIAGGAMTKISGKMVLLPQEGFRRARATSHPLAFFVFQIIECKDAPAGRLYRIMRYNITMPEKFKDKYQIRSARLENYDYSQNGMYFVTICTKNREEYFGEIVNGKMDLNNIGKIVYKELLQTSKIRSNINLDQWVIMPNHLHVIIEIINISNGVETPRRGVSTISENKSKCGGFNKNWKPNSLGSIINQFKSVCTKRIWKSGSYTFAWQSRFYDRVIRNEIELNKIREYIQNNPAEWEQDRNLPAGEAGNPENLWI